MTAYGRSVIEFKKNIVRADVALFEEFQIILNNYEEYSSRSYINIKKDLSNVNFDKEIQKVMEFRNLCSIKDLDYVKYLIRVIENAEVSSEKPEN